MRNHNFKLSHKIIYQTNRLYSFLQKPTQTIDSEKRLFEQRIGDKYVDYAINDKNLSQNVIRLADLKTNKIEKIIVYERRQSVMTDEESKSIGSIIREEIEKQNREQEANQTSQLFERSQIQEYKENHQKYNNQNQKSLIKNSSLDDSLFDFSFDELFDSQEIENLHAINEDLKQFKNQNYENKSQFLLSCNNCDKYEDKMIDTQSKLEQIESNLSQSLQAMKIQIKQQLQSKAVSFKMKNIKNRQVQQELNQQEERIRQKEEDLNYEVQTLLNTIDDHKKVNQRLNKHYQKRFKNIEKDLMSLYNTMIDQSGGLVGYNGILIGGNSQQNMLNSLGKQPLISSRQNAMLGLGQFGLGYSSSRNQLVDKSQNILNSHRQGQTVRNNLANTSSLQNLTPFQLQLSEIIQKLRFQMDLKVRLKDPLDENGAHLIPSSRFVSHRTNVFNNGIPQTGRTLNKCKSSARLDQAFVQNTSRSNLNLHSARNQGMSNRIRSGNQTNRRQNVRNNDLEILCETCLTNEYSMYSIEEEMAINKENQSEQVNQTLIRGYLGGKDPGDLTLSERDKLLSKILMKDFEAKQLPDAQHVKWQDILNFQLPQRQSRVLQPIQYTEKSESHASQQVLQLDSRKSSENFNKFIHDLSAIPALKNPSDRKDNDSLQDELEDISMITADQNIAKSFDNSFTLVDQIIASHKSSACGVQQNLHIEEQAQNTHKKQIKVPSLNLDKIKNQQNDFFQNNLLDAKLQQNDKQKKVMFDYQNIQLNEDSSINLIKENGQDSIQLNDAKECQNIVDQTLNFDESMIENVKEVQKEKTIQGTSIKKSNKPLGEQSLVLSPIHIEETESKVDTLLFSNTNEKHCIDTQNSNQQKADLKPTPFQIQDQQTFGLQNNDQFQDLKQKLEFHFENFNLQKNIGLISNTEQIKEEVFGKTYKRSRQVQLTQDSSTNKLIQNLDDLFNPQRNSDCQNKSLEETKTFKKNKSSEKKKIIIKRADIAIKKGSQDTQVQIFFSKPGSESAQSNNFTLGPQINNDFTKDSFDQTKEMREAQHFQNQTVEYVDNNHNNDIQKLKNNRQSSAKTRPIIAKQINCLFSNQAINTSITKQRFGNKSQVSHQSEGNTKVRLKIQQKYPSQNLKQDPNDISKDLIQLTEYLTLTNQIPKTQDGQNNLTNFKHYQNQSASPKLTQIPIKQSQVQFIGKPNQSLKLESIQFSEEQKQSHTNYMTNQSNIISVPINMNKISLSKLKIKNLKPINQTALQIQSMSSNLTTIGAYQNELNAQNQTMNKLDQSSIILTHPILIKRPILKLNKAQIVTKTRNLDENSAKDSSQSQPRSFNFKINLSQKNQKLTSNNNQTVVNQSAASAYNDEQNQKPQLSNRYLMRRINKAAQDQQQQSSQDPIIQQFSHQTENIQALNKVLSNFQPLLQNQNLSQQIEQQNQNFLQNQQKIFTYKSVTPKNIPINQSMINQQIQQSLMQMNQTISNKSQSNLQYSGSNSKKGLNNQKQLNTSSHTDAQQVIKKQTQKSLNNSGVKKSSTTIINNARLKILRNRAQVQQQNNLNHTDSNSLSQHLSQLNIEQQQHQQQFQSNLLSECEFVRNSFRASNSQKSGSNSHRLNQSHQNLVNLAPNNQQYFTGSSNNLLDNHQGQNNNNQYFTFYNDLNMKFNQTADSLRSHREFSANNSSRKNSQRSKQQQTFQQNRVKYSMNNNKKGNQKLISDQGLIASLLQTSTFNQQSARSQGSSKVSSARRATVNNKQSLKNLR